MKCRLRILDTKSSKSIKGSQSWSVSITTDTKSSVVNKNRSKKPFHKLAKHAGRHHNFKVQFLQKNNFNCARKKLTMITRTTEQCRMCNRGLRSYDIPFDTHERKETYTFVKSPRAILHIQKKYRNPPM